MKIETYEKAKELQEAIANLEKILGFAETKGIDTVQVCFGNVNTHVKHNMAKQEIINALEKSKEELQHQFDILSESWTMSRKELEVGDVVTIKSDLVVGENYGGFIFIKEMENYNGNKVMIINKKYSHFSKVDYYIVDIDDNAIGWTKEMFEGYENE